MTIDFLRNPNITVPPPSLNLAYSDDEMAQIHASADLTVFIQLFGRKLGSFQLGSYLHGYFKLDGRVEVYEHGHCRYSAKFSSQQDYDRATHRSTWKISDHYSIEIYKYQPNLQFGKVPLFRAGDFVEARLEGLPIEYFVEIAVSKLVNAVCEPLGCQFLRVDSSKGKPPRFWFQLTDSECCLDLPLHVQIVDGPLVGLSYSRAQQCYHCGGFGHFRKTCPELNQWTRSLNRATPSTSGPSQVHHSYFSRQPVPVPDLSSPTSLPEDTQGGIQDHETISHMSSEVSREGTSEIASFSPIEDHETISHMSSEESREGTSEIAPFSPIEDHETISHMSSEESREGTSEITPFSPIEFFARTSGSISPSRPIEETTMGAKGAILVENGGESRAKLYSIGEEVCEIDVAVKVTNLNDQRGNQRRVTIIPHAGNVPRCSKKLLYTTIEDVDDRNALRALKDTCDMKDVSMAIVFDKSSVLINDDQIIRCFGFSASHSSEMTFRSFGSDGSVRDVKGNCLLMWNREELRVNVSPVSYGNTQLLSQHLEFNASWLVVESDLDESSNGFSSSEGESSIDSSQSGDTDSDESLVFISSEEGISNESSTSSSSSSESSISLPNSATHSRDVKGNCLLMWNGEELRMNVSPVWYGNTQLLSQHLEFNALWLVESDSDESTNGFSSSEGESSIDSSQSGDTDSDESLVFISSEEGISNESSTSSSSSSESSISLPNSATHSRDVKGNCLLMWNGEDLRMNVSPVWYPNTQLLSQHLEFNALWLVESDSDESTNRSSSSEGESSIDSSQSGDTDSDESLVFTSSEEGISNESSTSSSSSSESSTSFPNSATHSRDVKGNCLLMWNGEELRMNVSPVWYGNTQLLSQHLKFNALWLVESDSDESTNRSSSSEGESSIDSSQSGDTDSDESSLFTSSSEGISNESSTSSSSSSESSISLPNSATHSEESSLFSTDAEEISNGSSAPSTSEESDDSFVLSPNGE